MPRIRTQKITTRLNYKYETEKGYQVLFGIRNYSVNSFRIKVLNPKGKIIN